MWVYDEEIGGQLLSNIINKDHENVKYLPGFVLPNNVVAIPELKKVCEDSNILIFALPHQYLSKTLENIKDYIDPSKTDCISLIKGKNYQKNINKINNIDNNNILIFYFQVQNLIHLDLHFILILLKILLEFKM